jgi:hypothetical protein
MLCRSQFDNSIYYRTDGHCTFERSLINRQANIIWNGLRSSANSTVILFLSKYSRIYEFHTLLTILTSRSTQDHSSEVLIDQLIKKITHPLWNSKVHYPIHMAIISQWNPIYTLTYNLFKICLNVSLPSIFSSHD